MSRLAAAAAPLAGAALESMSGGARRKCTELAIAGGASAVTNNHASPSVAGVLICCALAHVVLDRGIRAHRGRRREAAKSPGGNTMASSHFSGVRRRQPHISLPPPVHSLNTAYPSASLFGHSWRWQSSHRPSCAHTCSQARPPPQVRSAAWSRTSRRSSYVDASSFDALALEASIVLTCPFYSKKCMSCGRGGGSQYTLYGVPRGVSPFAKEHGFRAPAGPAPRDLACQMRAAGAHLTQKTVCKKLFSLPRSMFLRFAAFPACLEASPRSSSQRHAVTSAAS